MTSGTILVAGASGLVGGTIVNRFAAEQWEVVAISRRPPIRPVAGVRYLSVDLQNQEECSRLFRTLTNVTHVAYAAVNETPGSLVEGWSELDQIRQNGLMLENLCEPLISTASGFRHITLVHGTKAYGAHLVARTMIPFRERMPRVQHPNFYFLQQDYLAKKQLGNSWAWTILRPSLVLGGSPQSHLNTLFAFALYAALRREAGLSAPFPGRRSSPTVFDAVDACILGKAALWAATDSAAAGQVFNLTNGDVFIWADFWDWVTSEIGVTTGEDSPYTIREEALAKRTEWARAIAQHQLAASEDLLIKNEMSLTLADFVMQLPSHLTSTIKIRQAGFQECIDTECSVRNWIRQWREERFLPPRQ